ncbi:MAG TPA: hypothetical protein PK469_00695 [bacterium]|jgi:hypothetical protein|nr:hypothetical protein [bacterium]
MGRKTSRRRRVQLASRVVIGMRRSANNKRRKEEFENEEFETKKRAVRCEAFSGCRCTICGGFFEDGGDACSPGRHVIGQTYFI